MLIEEKVRKIRDVAAEAARMRSLHSDQKVENLNLNLDDNSQKKSSADNGRGSKKSAKNSSEYPSDDDSDHERDADRELGVRCRLVLTCFAPDGSPLLGSI